MNQSSGPADKALSTQFIEASKPTGHRCRPDERRALIHREEKRGSGDITRRGSDDAALNPSNPRSERGTTHCKTDRLGTMRTVFARGHVRSRTTLEIRMLTRRTNAYDYSNLKAAGASATTAIPQTTSLPNSDDPLGLFGDGPPWWTISKGKPWQRPSSSDARGDEAARRDSVQAALAREPRRLVGGQSDGDINRGISAGRQTRSVCSATEPVSERRVSNLHTGATTMVRDRDTVHVLRPLIRDPNYRPQVLSLVPEFGRIPVGSLSAFDIDAFLDV